MPRLIKTNHKAFTLVELLVTISIIGLLTSIVLVVVKDKTPKADIAKTMQWSRSIESLLGAYAVGIWNFDEGTGTTAADLSGYGNDGTLMNDPTWRCAEDDSSYTPSGHGCALEFDGVGSYIRVNNNSTLRVSEITVSAWIKISMASLDNSEYIVNKEDGSSSTWGGYSLYKDNPTWSNDYRFVFRTINEDGVWSDYARTGYLNKIGWINIMGIFGNGIHNLYVDGILEASYNGASYNALSSEDNSSLIIGSCSWDQADLSFDGQIDDVRIYETALTSAQAEALYYVGLDNLYNKGKITRQEYQKRLSLATRR